MTVDPVGAAAVRTGGAPIEAYAGSSGLFDEVEVAFGRESPTIEMQPSDSFIATTWWTAHIAATRSHVDAERFVYLIQEYEPFTFPMGTFAALADQSYAFPHSALFSSELLRDYFRAHGIGVYADGRGGGDRDSLAFENAITRVGRRRRARARGAAPRAGCCSTRVPSRTPRATCSSSGCSASARALRTVRSRRLGAQRDRDRAARRPDRRSAAGRR